MLTNRQRRWPNMKTILGERFTFARCLARYHGVSSKRSPAHGIKITVNDALMSELLPVIWFKLNKSDYSDLSTVNSTCDHITWPQLANVWFKSARGIQIASYGFPIYHTDDLVYLWPGYEFESRFDLLVGCIGLQNEHVTVYEMKLMF